MGRKEVKRSCCTWPKILALVLFSIIVGVLIWQFAPVDKALDDIIPQFNRTDADSGSNSNGNGDNNGGGSDGNGGNNGGDGNGNGGDDTTSGYQFMQCSQQAIAAGNCCNGLDNICDLGVDDILFASTHNANAAYDNGFLVAPNHNKVFQESLTAGFRGVNFDICDCNGRYQFCHNFCNVGDLEIDPTLADIDKFLDDNPTEVILLNIQFNDGVDINIFDAMVRQVNNGAFAKKLYVHPAPEAAWPTLREAIAAKTRLLMFHHNGPDCSVVSCPAGLHYWFQYAAETQFEFINTDSVDNLAYSCNITRGRGPYSETFFGVNSFVTPPRVAAARQLNAYDATRARLEACSKQNRNLDVNVVSVDFWSEGELPRVVQDVNRALGTRRKRRKLRATR